MSALAILSIFIFIIIFIIFMEYRNEKKYQATKRENRQRQTDKKKAPPEQTVKRVRPKKVIQEPKPEPKPELKPEPEPEKVAETPQAVKETKKLPEANYPQFTHVRLVEMGLSDEEAKEFVAELIQQLEVEIPLIEVAIQDEDFHKTERLTHGIKGSATNLGTGGVSDLLIDFNTYLKTGTDIDIVKAYLEHLIRYTNDLKAQYAH